VDEKEPQPIETKRLIVGMALAMAVVLGWQFFVPYLYKKMGWAMPGTNAPTAQTQPSTAPTATTQFAGVENGSGPTTGPAAGGLRAVGETGVPRAAAVGSAAV
jgi:hypothetical protein